MAAGGAVEPCAKTEWFWRVGKVGQSGLELPQLRGLTDPADARVIGSPGERTATHPRIHSLVACGFGSVLPRRELTAR